MTKSKITCILVGDNGRKEVTITLSKKAEKELEEAKLKICKPCPFYKKECKGKCLIRC